MLHFMQQRHGCWFRQTEEDWKLLKCGYGEEWKGQLDGQMRNFWALRKVSVDRRLLHSKEALMDQSCFETRRSSLWNCYRSNEENKRKIQMLHDLAMGDGYGTPRESRTERRRLETQWKDVNNWTRRLLMMMMLDHHGCIPQPTWYKSEKLAAVVTTWHHS